MNDKCTIAVSIVTYKNSFAELQKCVNSILASTIPVELRIIDNSPQDHIRSICTPEVKYTFNNANLGYGAGHNIAIRKSIENDIKYHLVVNPDVYFDADVLEKLYEFMQAHSDVGFVMPKILHPDGSLQHLCKLLPTPFDLFRRRFMPPLQYFNKQNEKYELRFTGYGKAMEVPYLSGCFMFLSTQALKKVGLFDERFFMYLEDTDLSRRLHKYYKTVYFPDVSVYHSYGKGSYKNLDLLKYHIKSTISYFSKWGYFFDDERKTVNANTLKKYFEAISLTSTDQTNDSKEAAIKVSIITVCLNSDQTIEDTVKSVFNQSYKDIEYIVVDGASTDGTLDLLMKYRNQIHNYISESDKGIYEAMNKGLKLASGDIIGILNSDDFYYDSDVVKMVAEIFSNNDIDCCYGDLEYVDYHNTDEVVRKWTSRPYTPGLFRKGFHPPHPTFFAKKELFEKYGYFNLDLDISADYELMLRFMERHGAKSFYIPHVFVKMRSGGASNRNLKQIIKANWQCYKAWRINGFEVSTATILKKPFSKIFQYFYAKN